MSQYPGTFSDPIAAYHAQNRALMDQTAAMLARNAQMLQTAVPYNSTYQQIQPFSAPSMFSQFSGLAGSVFGPEVGGIVQLAAPLVTSPGIAPFLGPIPGLITTMQQSMSIGSAGDPGAFLYSQLQSRMGKSVPQFSLPTTFGNTASIDVFNEQMSQYATFIQGQAPVAEMVPINPALGDAESAYGLGIQLKNIQTLRQSNRFKDAFSLYEAATGQKISDQRLQDLIDASEAGNTTQADALLAATPELRTAAQQVIKNAESAASFTNFALQANRMLPQIAQMLGGDPGTASALQGLGDALMDITGLSRDPAAFTAAAIQSLSSVGALGMTSSGVDAMGRPIMATDRLTAGILRNIENAESPFTGIRNAGMVRTGETLQELSRSGMLNTAGVDTFGLISTDDIKRMETSISRQLEAFTEIANVGKRLGVQVNEITASMQRMYSGRFAQELSSEAGRQFATLESQFVGPIDDQTREFLKAEAQRKAGATMMQQVEAAVQVGRFAGLDSRGSLAVLETSAQLAESLGLSGSAGISMGSTAMARVALSRTMGLPVTFEQALAQQQDIMAKGKQNPSVKAFAALNLAVDSGILKEGDATVVDLKRRFNAGEDISLETVTGMIAATGANVSRFVSDEAVAAGMSLREVGPAVNRFYASNEGVNLIGSVKRAFQASGVDSEKMVQDIIGQNKAEDIARVLNIDVQEVAGMDMLQFSTAFNALGSQQERMAALESLNVDERTRSVIMSYLGDRVNAFGLAGDRGTQKTAMVRLREEAERQKFGITSVEATAMATAQVQSDVSQLMRNQFGNYRQGVSSALDTIRERKIQDYMAAGLTEEEARIEVDKEGFTMSDLIEVASGTSQEQLNDIVASAQDRAQQEYDAAVNSGDLAGQTIAERKMAQLEDIESIRTAATPEAKEQRAQEIRDRLDQQMADLEASKTPEQKAAEAQQDAQAAANKSLPIIQTTAQTIEETVKALSESISSISKTLEALGARILGG